MLARGVDEFVGAIAQALDRRGEEDRARRMAIAAENTWDTRVARLLGLVEDELGRTVPRSGA